MQHHKTTADGTHLLASIPLKRVQAHFQDLIIAHLEASLPNHSLSFALTEFQFAYGVALASKSCLRLNVLAKDLEHGDVIPLRLTFSVEELTS